MSRALFVDPVGGASGDMLLGAVLDAGAPRAALDDAVDALELIGVEIETTLCSEAGSGRSRPMSAP